MALLSARSIGSKIAAWAAALGTLVAAVLGADKLGVAIFPSGKNTDFWSKSVGDPTGKKQQLQLGVREGDVPCVVKVKIKDVKPGDQFTARYEGYANAPGPLLTMEPIDNEGWFHIHQEFQKGSPAADSRFTLYPYGRVVIENPKVPTRPIEAADWELLPKELGGYDSAGAFTMRRVIFWFFWISLLPIFYTVLLSLKLLPDDEEAAPATPESAAAALIDRLHGANEHDTELLRKLVERKAIRGETLTAACNALGISVPRGKAMLDRVRPAYRALFDPMNVFRNRV